MWLWCSEQTIRSLVCVRHLSRLVRGNLLRKLCRRYLRSVQCLTSQLLSAFASWYILLLRQSITSKFPTVKLVILCMLFTCYFWVQMCRLFKRYIIVQGKNFFDVVFNCVQLWNTCKLTVMCDSDSNWIIFLLCYYFCATVTTFLSCLLQRYLVLGKSMTLEWSSF